MANSGGMQEGLSILLEDQLGILLIVQKLVNKVTFRKEITIKGKNIDISNDIIGRKIISTLSKITKIRKERIEGAR